MTYLWCQTTHQGNQLPWELRYSIKPVWIRLWEQQTPFKSFHISRQRKPWTSRHFDGICRTDVKKTTNARSRDSSFHQSPKTRSEVNGPDKDHDYHMKREHDATKRKMCGKNNITSRHYIKYLHSRIYPNYVWVYFAMELRLVALGNSAIEGIHKPSDRISSSV